MEHQYRADADEISLFDLWRVIKKYLLPIIIFCFGMTFIVGVITYFLYPKNTRAVLFFTLMKENKEVL